ncbi:MAG TPA: amino acid adenylation domain-containing protein, partial [Thermoanaerobaculia bacterium]|nr:amino acid adenylation domain-containing protein [Thermoanaerobaculia bacterium]
APAGVVPVRLIDLSGLPEGVREPELAHLAAEEARHSFDLANGPLLRLLLLRLAAEDHAAVFNAHHIATDGWSMGVLVRELGALYDARLAGQPSPLAELPIQYADFAVWQRERLAGEVLAEQLAWWRRELASAPHLLPLATDRPRPPIRSPRGAVVPVALPADLAAAVESLALGGNSTPFMVLMAAFQALLLRATGAEDLLVGFPVAGRPRPETEPLIGFFVNTLPLRGRPAPDSSWGELLGQVRTATLGALAHQELPFERLLDELGVERSLAHTPLVQVALALQNTPFPEFSLSGLTLVPWEVHPGTAKFDLSLSLTRTPEGLAGTIEYASDLFDAATVQRLGGHFRTLLQGAVEAPGTLLADLPLMTAAERHQVEFEWNDTREEETALCLHEVFAAWAETTPEATAVVFGEESLTYGELQRRATQLARHLRALGVAPESRVGIFVEPGVDPLVASLATLEAGGTYVPLDISYPEERLAFMLEDAGVRVLLTRERLVPSLPSHRAEVVLLDGDLPGETATGAFDTAFGVARRPAPDDIAYITYTSGSTGRPNGVLTRHRSAAHFAYQSAADFAIGPGDRVLQAASWSFDGWVQETWGAFAAGATLCVSRREAEIGGEALEEAMRRMGVTAAFVTPGRLATLTPEGIPGVRSLASGGEALPKELAARFIPGRRFLNCYGPTETTVYTSVHRFSRFSEDTADPEPSIGRPYGGAQIYLLDRSGRLVPLGSPGEIHIAGEGLARGYLDRPALTAERFVPHFAPAVPGERLYRTGDLARYRTDGTIEFLGRIDHQVKLRGQRIELGEIETVLGRHPGVRESRVVVREDGAGGPGSGKRLVAYLLPAGEEAPAAAELREHLREHLPEHMVPAALVALPAWPLTPNGKIDWKALPAPEGRAEATAGLVEPRGETERAVARVWQEVLGVDRVGAHDNFFDLGGHSLLMPRLHALLKAALGERGRGLTLVDLFRFPTVGTLAGFLHPAGSEPEPLERSRDRALARQGALERRDRRIAIVGMSVRFPGASDAERFWENLASGIESIRHLSPEDLAGADPALVGNPRHVPAVSIPDGIEEFDALFFGFSHREAEILDPQQRLFLEVAWEALEDAAHDPATSGRAVGVFAGTALSTYLLHHLAHDEEVRRSVDPVQVLIGNAPDSLATRVSYKLDLKGPSYTLQSACSTALVAVHHACHSLLAGECDVALAGGSSLPLGHRSGYLYLEGSTASPDGHCRAFDARARGTVFGGGAGAVVLKRLADAEAAGDTIRAVLLGSAVNNDGLDKVGYTAPSVTGQAEVIAEALAVAGVGPATISYVETHGTGTPVGDPIEIAALTQVIGAAGRSAPCAIGSVKTNIGHLDTAAGVAGLVKTVLALEHGQIPPSLHFEEPNPEIDFAGSLYVNAVLAPWIADGTPRRAGVSSFGIGGTNAHVVLEEAPRRVAAPSARSHHLLVLSARSEEALDRMAERLAAYLERHPEIGIADLADVAWTLGTGRRAFPVRRIAAVRDREDAIRALAGGAEVSETEPGPRQVAFLFSGQGSQYPGMGRGLYEEEPVFRREMDRAAEILAPLLGLDLRQILFPAVIDEAAEERLRQTALAQPALFAFEHALARQWMEWGITPTALTGHSLGEYVAACLAGVFTFEDALRLVVLRGQLMQEMPPGAMLAVSLSEEEVSPLLGADLSVAAVNEPARSVVAGPFEAIAELEGRLATAGVGCRRLHTSHAFHSRMMEPVLDRFAAAVAKVRLSPPRLPFVSNVTGTWITAEEATDPAYWARHLRAPVRFADGVATLLRDEGRILLEVGPGNALATLARRQTDGSRVVASTHPARQTADDAEVLLAALGRLWLAGLPLDWARLYPGERRRRVPLPTYPFERERYWIEGIAGIEAGTGEAPVRERRKTAAASSETDAPVRTRLHARPRLQTAFVAPRDEPEREIAAVWQELLGVDPVGVDDDFFALGGHSLLGVQLLSRVRQSFGVDLPLDTLFEAPTVASLARRVETQRPRSSPAFAPPGIADIPIEERLRLLATLEPGSILYRLVASLTVEAGVEAGAGAPEAREEPLRPTGATEAPLYFSQERLWFLDRLQPGSSVYNIPAVLRLRGDLRLDVLRRSFTEIVRRHGSLRTTFAEFDGEPRQVVAPPGPVALPVLDLSGLPAPQGDREAARIVAGEVDRSFDLEHGPLLRIHLLRHGHRDHTLIANVHHIVSDGWSMGVMVNETTVLYAAFLQERPSPLPELPVQYTDFALWQRQRLSGPALQAELDFWRRELSGAPALLELPTDHPRPAVQSYRGANINFTLEPEATAAVRKLAQQAGVTPFMVFLAAFQSLLHRWSGTDDVVVASLHANRSRVEIEGLIGFFVNVLVFRLYLGEEEGFLGLVERARARTLAVHAHQDLPFELLVEELGIERSLAHNPLFQVMLVFQNFEAGELKAPGLTLTPVEAPIVTSKFDLLLTLFDSPGDFTGAVEFALDLFDLPTVARFVTQYQTLLKAVAADPGLPVSRLPLMNAAERHQVLLAWNDTAVVLPLEQPFASLFAAQVARRSLAPAVTAGPPQSPVTLTYAELDRRADRLGRVLRAHGAGPESLIALLDDRGIDLLTAILAVFKVGAAYLPLDPAHPAPRIRQVLGQSGARLVLSGEPHRPILEEALAEMEEPPRVGSISAPATETGEDLPILRALPDSLAYVIFTSGSTGLPKGAMVSQRGMVNHLWAKVRDLDLGPEDAVAQTASQCFDISVWQHLAVLAVGGRVRIYPDDVAHDPPVLLARVAEERLTVLQTVPSLLREMLEDVERGGRTAPDLSALRFIVPTGEALAPDLWARWLRLYPGIPLVNAYGPTECSDDVAHALLATPPPGQGLIRVPVGSPVVNTSLYVLDRNLETVPPGVAGELAVGGAGVGRGYLDDPVRTALVFVPDPFSGISGEPGARLYRTGDLTRRRADGAVEFLGRIDHQVKVRGYRIELGEIESALCKHPAVREAVVLAREDRPGGKRLAAYVVLRETEELSPAALRASLAERLPEYMVPADWVVLEALPLTPNGKIDRTALPAPERRDGEAVKEPPRTATEVRLAEIWTDLLGIEAPGREESFFDLGGHSLLAARLLSRMRETFRSELPLRVIFEVPTVSGLAERIDALSTPESLEEPLVPTGVTEAPLFFSQERVWFLDRLQPGSSLYNIPVALRLTGDLDVSALRQSFTEITRRHGSLRTTFAEIDGEPRQVVSPPAAVPLPVIDLAGLPAPQREKEAEGLVAQEVGRPFDLTRGPLLRLQLLRQGRREHTLVANVHHIVSDGWSSGVLVGESTALYEAFVQGLPSPLPELPIQYVDFALWQRRRLSGALLEAQLDFWRRELAGAPALLELPTDRPRPAEPSSRGASLPLLLSAQATAAVHTLAREAGATPFMVLLAALQTLLHRYSGVDDVVVGSLDANRSRVQVEGLIGFFVNILVFRLHLREGEGFLTVLEHVRATTLAVHAHQDLPFELLVDTLGVERSLAHNPLFQVMLLLQNAPAGELKAPGLTFSPVDTPSTTAKFDLLLTLTEIAGGLAGTLEYALDLFDAPTVARFGAHFRTLLEAVAADPELPVGRLPLMTAAERHQTLLAWNDTGLALPLNQPFAGLFAAQVARRPEAPAVTAGERERPVTLTYAELDRRADRLGRVLQAHGAGPEVLIALLGDRGLDLLTAILAVLKVGAAYLPLDPAHPAPRIRQVLCQSGARLVLTGEPHRPVLEAALAEMEGPPRVEPIAAPETESGEELPALRALPDSLAYVIFTSGSTGLPKGAMVSQRGMVNHLWAKIRDLGLGAGDVVAQTASQCFDISVWQHLAALSVGGRVRIYSDDVAHDPPALLARVAEERVTVLQTVPSLLREMLEDVERGGRTAPDLSSLRWLIPTGEALAPDLWGRWLRLYPAIPLVNAYGPTECSDDVTHALLAAPPPGGGSIRVPVGRPVVNTRLYVVDRSLTAVLPGVAGELCVGGPGVGRGYLDDPVRTALVFVPDPFSGISGAPGARLYRTGDLTRRRADGAVEFLGRIDHQVKVRGYRIELGEIEAALGKHPVVRDVAVLAREDRPGDKRLTAYVVPREEELAPAVLRAFLAERLPEYMVPVDWVLLEALPLTPNGKVDRNILPAPERGDGDAVQEPPRTATEARLAEIWTELLGVATPGREESFFDLGGHSLLATRILSRVREAFRVELPLRALFEAPTIAGFAERIDAMNAPAALEEPPLLLTDVTEAPLSFAQERLWFLDRLQPDSSLYNIPAVLSLAGDLDASALLRSFGEIVRRHGSLRATFTEIDGEPRQRIAPPGPVPLPLIDLSGLPAPHRDYEAQRLIAQEVGRPFDLAHAPLLRLHLLRRGHRDHTLIANIHHIASDGWSTGVLVHESTVLYEAFVQGLPSPLPELPVQYADFALWQRRRFSGPVLEAQLDFWRRELAGAPMLLELPADRSRPAVQSYRGASIELTLPAEATDAVSALARQAGATPFMVLLAAFQTLLHRCSGADDVLVGSPIANRNRVGIEGLIGFFVNTLVFRLRVRKGEGFLAVLERVRATTLAGHDHQDLPFELLVETLGVPRSLAHNPVFQVMLVLQNAPAGELRVPGLTFVPVDPPSATAKFDMTLSLHEASGGIAGRLEYATDLFDRTTVQRFLGHFGNLLASAAADPGQPLSRLRLMDAAEERQVLAGLNPAGRSWALPVAVHELFIEQARRTPDKAAAVGPQGEMTYRELDERSTALAARLRSTGARPDSRVALLADPDPQVLVGMLGILKAGGGFVPLDPRSPDERLTWILEDSTCEVMVTQWRHLERAAGLARTLLCLEDLDAAGTVAAIPAPVEPGSLAYIVYTSGSTGRPKGVQISHQSLVPMLLWGCEYLGLGE